VESVTLLLVLEAGLIFEETSLWGARIRRPGEQGRRNITPIRQTSNETDLPAILKSPNSDPFLKETAFLLLLEQRIFPRQ